MHATKRIYYALIGLCVFNFFAAVAVPLVIGVGVAIRKTVLVSRYHDFDVAGVINHDKLQVFENGAFSQSWTLLPEDLGKGEDDYVTLGWIISVFFAANGVTLIFAIATIRGTFLRDRTRGRPGFPVIDAKP